MNNKILIAFTLLFLLAVQTVFARPAIKRNLVLRNNRPYAVHTIEAGETIYSVAQKYAVPAIVLSQNNNLSFYDKLVPGGTLYIPLGNYNYQKTTPVSGTAADLMYVPLSGDSYESVARLMEIPQEQLRGINSNKPIGELRAGMLVGWVTYVGQENSVTTISPSAETPKFPIAQESDTISAPISDWEKIYNYQTTNETYLDSLTGMVVFFKPQTNVGSTGYYAFSNDLARGRVLKIVNPSNGRFVWAKVIGPLPGTKQYLNAKLGLDGRARENLETREVKLWCKFFFKY